MGKRKNRDPGGNPQIHPTRSFEQLVAEATRAKLGAYIDEQIEGAAQAILGRQQRALQGVFRRIVCLEEILMETVPGLTKESLAVRVSNIEDRADGFEATDEVVREGDRVRVEVKTRTIDQTEFQGASRLQIDNVGSGATLGKELETAIIGMKAGETKEIKFGKDESIVASISLDKVSREILETKAEQPSDGNEAVDATAGAEVVDESTVQNEAPAVQATAEEPANVSPDAG